MSNLIWSFHPSFHFFTMRLYNCVMLVMLVDSGDGVMVIVVVKTDNVISTWWLSLLLFGCLVAVSRASTFYNR